jgi:hypothetical protein
MLKPETRWAMPLETPGARPWLETAPAVSGFAPLRIALMQAAASLPVRDGGYF